MAQASKIEWTEATWNPIVGCSIVSPGCTNCYAMRMAARIEAADVARINATGDYDRPATHYSHTTRRVNGNPVWTGHVARAPERVLMEPLRRRKPTMWFVNSMGDLFHEDVPDEWIDRVFAVMALCPQHTFQLLSKRAVRMKEYMNDTRRSDLIAREIRRIGNRPGGPGLADAQTARPGMGKRRHARTRSENESVLSDLCPQDLGTHLVWPLRNVWKGVSAERQQEADERIPHLLQTPAAVRFMSCEPLLGPIDLTRIEAPEKVEGEHWTFDALAAGDMYYRRIERDFDPPLWDAADGPYRDHALGWIIVGGESGLGARPMHPQWARDLRDQCEAAGVAYFFKQWGTWTPCLYGRPHSCEVEHVFPDGQAMLPVSKRAAGRLLDGVEHNGMPEVRT